MVLGYDWTQVGYVQVKRGGSTIGFKINAKIERQDINNNYTIVNTNLRSDVEVGSLAGSGYNFTLTGASGRSGTDVWYFDNEYILWGTYTVYHNSDGTASSSPSAYLYNKYWGIDQSFSGYFTLPTIPRASKINTFTGSDIDGNFSATYTAYVSSWENRLRIAIPGVQELQVTNNYTSGTNVTLTTTAKTALKNYMNTNGVNKVTIKGEIQTYNGSTLIGTSSAINVEVSFSNSNPTFSYTIAEANTKVSGVMGTTAANLIQGASIARIVVTPSAKQGATIKQVKITNDGKEYIKTASPYSFDITPTTTATFTVEILDVRGNIGTGTITKTLKTYTPLKKNSFSFKRVNPTSSNVIFKLDSDYIQATYNSKANAPVIKWKLNDGSYKTISAYTYDSTKKTITVETTLTNALSYKESGTFSFLVEDLFTSISDEVPITKGIPLIDIGENDVQINGTLYIASEDGENARPVTGDALPINSIFDYDGTEVPDGYERVTDGTILFSNNSGTQGTITLSDTIANYSYLEIVINRGITHKIYLIPEVLNSYEFPLVHHWRDSANDTAGVFTNFYKVNGNQLEYSTSRRWYQYGVTNNPYIDTNNSIWIYKVIGYKD